ncbi:FtsW/RodA/SpoVE family cell cycle protein [Paludibacter sp. 221]|uniref:FtsW/RodA/SpoVE family cell cycle protein n=1 Tax=Paludibacter sp. 221 TaxID=2302939 RepID=UPI0013D31D78|nr:FtsW/RodA/SpoVE family cell cycle protein [Paludibacter sp. 221]NDV47569.1 FtsW/RodA/SpoVE family cell cycle protein [Paludibacter sp. 221]
MNSFFKKILRGDTTIWIVFLILCIGSVVIMYSASSTLAYAAARKQGSYFDPILKHAGYLALGIIIAYVIHFIPYKYIKILSYFGLIVSLILLILVQFKGVSENDATRWIDLFGIRFQPSEIAKLSLVIVCADFISRIKDNDPDSERIYFWRIIICTTIICLLILRENLSTALLLFGVIFILMLIGRISLKRLGIIVGILLITGVSGYFIIKVLPSDSKEKGFFHRADTWVGRIDNFISGKGNAEKYVKTDETQQPITAKIAIASGGAFGVGIGNSVQRDYLSLAYSDFIYAIVIEEGGLIIGVILILLYLILLFRTGQIATKCTTVFPAMLVIGLCLMIVIQAFVSMAVATGLGPVTGQPLPLISRGGTSIVITSVYFGIILGVTRQLKEEQRGEETVAEAEIPVVELDEL